MRTLGFVPAKERNYIAGKKNLKVADLLAKFEEVSGGEFANDRMMLS